MNALWALLKVEDTVELRDSHNKTKYMIRMESGNGGEREELVLFSPSESASSPPSPPHKLTIIENTDQHYILECRVTDITKLILTIKKKDSRFQCGLKNCRGFVSIRRIEYDHFCTHLGTYKFGACDTKTWCLVHSLFLCLY